jgi:hypothetical protein
MGDAPFWRWPGVQQSMGHLPSLSTAETLDIDTAAAASVWW